MIKWTIVALLLLGALAAEAHSPDISSTVLAENEDGSWVLQVRSAMTAFEFEVKNNFGEKSFKSPEEFQDLVIDYLKQNISITYDGDQVAQLEDGFVKLGHETSAVFKVAGIPKEFSSVTVKNESFKNIRKSQSALVIFKEGFAKDQFVLNDENGHTAKLKVSGAKFILEGPVANKPQSNLYYILAGIFVFLMGAGIGVYSNRKNKSKGLTVAFKKEEQKQYYN